MRRMHHCSAWSIVRAVCSNEFLECQRLESDVVMLSRLANMKQSIDALPASRVWTSMFVQNYCSSLGATAAYGYLVLCAS